jgi:very-short-patch-repair endonuclease
LKKNVSAVDKKLAFLATILEQRGMPRAEFEYRFHSRRRWRFDMAYPTVRLAIEVEGGVWSLGRHTRPSGFMADMEKYNTATTDGWHVLRFTPNQLLDLSTVECILHCHKNIVAIVLGGSIRNEEGVEDDEQAIQTAAT